MYQQALAHIREYTQILAEVSGQHLQHYVYVLRDPRDGKIFYVGEGSGARVLDHLGDTIEAESGQRAHTAKTRRIAEIWSVGEMVDWQIVSRGYTTQDEAEVAEAAVMSAVAASQNGALLNLIAGKHGTTRGPVLPDELRTLAAKPVDPQRAYPAVFLFPIHRALEAGRSNYDAIRCCWDVAEHWREHRSAIAVGLVRGISACAFQINSWIKCSDSEKYFFDGDETVDVQLVNFRWTQVINASRGYFQRGNWLAIEFDGQSKFKVLRGSSYKDWQPLL